MFAPGKPIAKLLEKGIALTREIEAFYETHGDDLDAEKEKEARRREKELDDLVAEIRACEPNVAINAIFLAIDNMSSIAAVDDASEEDIERGKLLAFFAQIFKKSALGEKWGHFERS